MSVTIKQTVCCIVTAFRTDLLRAESVNEIFHSKHRLRDSNGWPGYTDRTVPFLISVPAQKAYKPELQTMNLNKALHLIWQSWILFRVKSVILGEAPSLSYGSCRFPSFLFSTRRHDSLILCLSNGIAFKPHIIFNVQFYYFLWIVFGESMCKKRRFINMD